MNSAFAQPLDLQSVLPLKPTVTQLKNGMRLVLLEDHRAPVVALQIWVKFGSADEKAANAGVAHVFEHMLFKGTKKYPHGEVAALIEGAGGQVNAWTSFDETVYHTVMSSKGWQVGVDVLSEAVNNSLFDSNELKKELEVVLEEIRRGKDDPDREVSERLFQLIYKNHPYGRPIIGYDDVVARFTREDLLDVFHAWYVPNNFTFVAVGDFNSQAMKKAIEERFAKIAKKTLPIRPRVVESIQNQSRAESFNFNAQLARIEVGFPAVAAMHDDAPALDLLADILGSGYNSILYTKLKRDRNLVQTVSAYHYTPQDPGIFGVGASFKPDDYQEVIPLLLKELYRSKDLQLTPGELAAAKTRIISSFAHGQETAQGLAQLYGRAVVMHNDPSEPQQYMAALQAVTVDDLRRVANTYLQDIKANLVLMMPEGKVPPASSELLTWNQKAAARSIIRGLTGPRQENNQVSIYDVAPGLTLVVQQDASTPLVSISAQFLGGLRLESPGQEGSAALLAATWDKGTARRSASQIEQELDQLGGILSAGSDADSMKVSGRFLKVNLQPSLELFFDVLLNPSIAQDAFELEKSDQLGELASLVENRPRFLFTVFLADFYGDHPYNHLTLGKAEAVRKLNREDILALHKRLIEQQPLVISIVGQVDQQEIAAAVGQLLSPAFLQTKRNLDHKTFTMPQRTQMQERVVREKSQQTHIVWGFPTVTMNDGDRYPLQVLDAILSGMGGRLFMELRDQKSLAYSVTSFDTYPLDPGYLALYIGCAPEKEKEAIAEFERVLNEITTTGVTELELERAKTYIIGSTDIGLQGTLSRASTFSGGQLLRGKWNAYEENTKAIAAVTADDIKRVASKYLQEKYSVRSILRGQ